MSDPQVDFVRHRERFRAWLLGKEYYKAVEALEFASSFHTGFRKDGVTPEFAHQLAIVHYLRTLSNLRNQQLTLIAGLLHDTPEDKDISFEEIKTRFGVEACESVRALTKKHRGQKKNIDSYYQDIAVDPIASIVKGADRINNHQTISVFTSAKQQEYILETENYILPMLRNARNKFPDQELAYENIKYSLKGQIEFIKMVISSKGV